MLPSMVPHRGTLGQRQTRDVAALLATVSNVAPLQPVGEPVCSDFLSPAE